MEFAVSSILNIIMEAEKNTFFGIWGKIRLLKLKRKLYRNIFKEILKKYGNEIYYNDLDNFLTENKVIYNIIKNGMDVSIFEYRSKGQMITYYIGLFMGDYPKYCGYYNEIRGLFCKYFEVIFQTLNEMDSEETRIICNVTKELTQGLAEEMQKVQNTVSRIERKMDCLIEGASDEQALFLSKKYFEYLLYLYPQYPLDRYLERKLYAPHDTKKKADVLDVMLSEKKMIVLGEAGYGKTYESVILLNKICRDERTKELIPVYFSLQEYGTFYVDILGGIRYKIGPFCEGNTESLIEQWLEDGKLIFIFDGIDDIPEENFRTKFFMDANNLLAKYHKNYFFFTSRYNRYHRELDAQKEFFLTELKKEKIQQELREEGIYVNIPESFYQLFANPLFLDIGKKVLKQADNRDIFNKSQLFQELFLQLYGGIDQKKGLPQKTVVTYGEAIHILGRFAYETFSQASYSYLDFDSRLSKIIENKKAETIASFISSGLFKVLEGVTFLHKMFKEYCAAHYLTDQYPLSKNVDLYKDLIHREEWKEVFIFMGGIYHEREAQDEFLDFVMANNLPLYVECIKAKSDLRTDDDGGRIEDIAGRLLTQIYKTYTFITSEYFAPVKKWFEPQPPERACEEYQNRKTGITGYLTDKGDWLSYWFDFVSAEEETVCCIYEQQSPDYFTGFREKALKERRNICTHGLNLQRSGREGDSGRHIAIDLIKCQLKNIIEKKLLIESNYLLCERVADDKKKIKEIMHSSDLLEMQDVIDKLINEARKVAPSIEEYDYRGVKLFDLQKILHILNDSDISFSEYILPEEDRLHSETDSGWIWDMYSKEQKERRVILFFYYHELSYLDMVVKNFPELYHYFYRYQDIPYQVILGIDHKEEDTGFFAEPGIQYYYIAAEGEKIPMPILRECKEKLTIEWEREIFYRIRESYRKKGKNVHKASHTSALFSMTTTSNMAHANRPLSEYVYKTIKESLEEIFGDF